MPASAADGSGRTMLMLMAMVDDVEGITEAIAAGVAGDVNQKEPDFQRTAAWLACRHGSSRALVTLMDAGAKGCITDTDGMTSLMIASEFGHADIVRTLLSRGAGGSLNARSTELRTTALGFAAEHNRPDIVKLLLDASASASVRNAYGKPPLAMAVQNGHAQVVRAMLSHPKGGHVDECDEEFRASYLAQAAVLGFEPVVAELLRADAKPDIADNDGVTPLICALGNKRTRIALRLLRAKPMPDVNARSVTSGRTPAWLACFRNCSGVLGLLLAAGADASVPDSEGTSPLNIAANMGRLKLLRMLLDSGRAGPIDSTSGARNGATSLIHACMAGRRDAAAMLLAAGADPKKLDAKGCSPLGHAARAGHTEVVRLLLDPRHGLDVNFSALPEPGADSSPLSLAAALGSAEMVQILLNAGADPSHPAQMPPIGVALVAADPAGSAACAELLLRAGADLSVPDVNGQTPLQAARKWRNTACIALIENELRWRRRAALVCSRYAALTEGSA